MDEFTQTEVDVYVGRGHDYGGWDYCPVSKCTGNAIMSGSVTRSDNLMYQPCRCDKCGIEWEERYTLDDIEVTSEPG